MKILAIDTSTRFLSVAVYNEGRVSEYNLETANRLSMLLVPHIKRILEALHLKPGDINYFVCGLGPGSFTGIRIGLSTIKGFCFALNKPSIGIGTLDVLAMNARQWPDYKSVIAAVDAKRGMVYYCQYRKKEGRYIKVSPYSLIKKEDFIKKLNPASLVLGDVLGVYAGEISRALPCASFPDKDLWFPKAHNMVILALEKIKGANPKLKSGIEPVYLYPKECQIKKGK